MKAETFETIVERLVDRILELERHNADLQRANSELLERAREAELRLAGQAVKQRRIDALIMDIVEN